MSDGLIAEGDHPLVIPKRRQRPGIKFLISARPRPGMREGRRVGAIVNAVHVEQIFEAGDLRLELLLLFGSDRDEIALAHKA
jgi:hypothetical protein